MACDPLGFTPCGQLNVAANTRVHMEGWALRMADELIKSVYDKASLPGSKYTEAQVDSILTAKGYTRAEIESLKREQSYGMEAAAVLVLLALLGLVIYGFRRRICLGIQRIGAKVQRWKDALLNMNTAQKVVLLVGIGLLVLRLGIPSDIGNKGRGPACPRLSSLRSGHHT